MFRARIAASATLCLASTFLAACAVDDVEEQELAIRECAPIPKDRADRDLLEAIDALGLCGSSAVEAGAGYIVEDDIFIATSLLRDKQARTDVLVGQFPPVTVRVDASIPVGGVDDWRSAVQSAIDAWNAVPDTRVHLQFTTAATADITVQAGAGDWIGRGTFPTPDGRAGSVIEINLGWNNNTTVSESKKIGVAAHELGHNIGFRHTDWRVYSENPAIHIAGTPTTDSSSVMNSGNSGIHDFAGLSSYDVQALRTLYGEIITLNVEFTGCVSGTPRMSATWGGSFGLDTNGNPIGADGWRLDRYTNGAWSQITAVDTEQSWTFNVPTGQQLKLRVRGQTMYGWSTYHINTKTAPSCSTLPP